MPCLRAACRGICQVQRSDREPGAKRRGRQRLRRATRHDQRSDREPEAERRASRRDQRRIRMTYSVKEIYYTLQGEGAQAGRAAVFLRFAGCNLWSGRETDRLTAICTFCDTDFVGTDGCGGGKFTAPKELAAAVAAKWLGGNGKP